MILTLYYLQIKIYFQIKNLTQSISVFPFLFSILDLLIFYLIIFTKIYYHYTKKNYLFHFSIFVKIIK